MGGRVLISVDNVVSLISDVSGDTLLPATRDSIIELEDKIRTELAPANMPVRHLFSGNIYARELFIPKGTVLTGRMYLVDHIDMMVYGDLTISSEDGTKRVSGYCVLPSVKGKKRAAYAHEDTLWITFCECEEPTEAFYETHIAIEDSKTYEQALINRRIIDESIIKEAFGDSDQEYEVFKAGYLAGSGKLTAEQAELLRKSL